jgi:hypothetical protein
VIAGIVVRFVPLGLPSFVTKYGGSMLWALMIYWVLSALLPAWREWMVVLISGSIATAVEFFKLYRSPGMDAFRHTLPGILLLGRIFSLWDIVAYWIAVCIGSYFDGRMRHDAR